MIGTTGVKDLRIDCIVGVFAHERQHEQPVFLDIELDYDFGAAAASDAIDDAADYDKVVSRVTTFVRDERFHLIEAMAERTVAMLLSEFPAIQSVRLEIRKPAAVPAASCSFVRVSRFRA